jgi:hypothetical protein
VSVEWTGIAIFRNAADGGFALHVSIIDYEDAKNAGGLPKGQIPCIQSQRAALG